MNYRLFFYAVTFLSISFLPAQMNDSDLKEKGFYVEKKTEQAQDAQPIAYAVNKGFAVAQNIRIDLKPKSRVEIVNALRNLLADNYVLYTKALNFHWNVEGTHFSATHKFFKKIYEHLQATNDKLAERIRALGGYSPGSLQEFLTLTQLQENLGKPLHYRAMYQIMLDDFETVIRSLRKAIDLSTQYNDWGTNNMLSEMIEKQEKNAWMLRAHLAGKK